MEELKRVFVSIYCMIFNNDFSDGMFNKMATGKEIYDFLMEDAGMCWMDNEPIPGDCNLWYLGCNKKYGVLQFKNIIMDWGFGESSFDRVEAFVLMVYLEGVFTEEQYRNLIVKIQEGRQIDNMCDIKAYLIARRKGRPWVKTREAAEFRENVKKFVARVQKHLQDEGFLLYSPTNH